MTPTELHKELEPVRELVKLSKELINLIESERMTQQDMTDNMAIKYIAKQFAAGNKDPLKEHNKNQDKRNGNH